MAGLPTAAEPFTLHGRSNSGSAYKPALMLALCGLKFTPVLVRANEQRSPDFLRLNPFGQVPVLEHGQLVISQSPTMLRHIARIAGRYDVTDPCLSLEADEWLAWEQDMVFPGIAYTRFLMRTTPENLQTIAFLRARGERALSILEARLAGNGAGSSAPRLWLVGDEPSFVDVAVYAYARVIEEAGFDMALLPAIVAWRLRVEALPGWRKPQDLLPTA